MELAPPSHRGHKKAKAGAKAEKKRLAEKKKKGLSTQRHNPRAFSVANVRRTQRSTQRNLDRAQRKEYVPVVNRAEDDPPPFVTVVMGPSGCGKSTLIRSLVKFYSNSNIRKVAGPITVVTGKRQRMTLFECPSDDLSAMVDLAKVADLVLLLIDASFGFEMETFEFLNILQVHGFPRVMGVLTKLDAFRENKALRNAKKKLKHRFWTEIYKGAKMFHMNGVTHGKYPKGEIRLLHLYMSRLKFRPLLWRNAHSYVLVDRVEDISDPREVQKHHGANDRDVALFGYVRGTHLKPNTEMHLVGAGDFSVGSVSLVSDPCPVADTTSNLKTLKKKANMVYAPMSDIGSVRMDADAVYIDIAQINYTKRAELEESLNISGAGDIITDTGRVIDPLLLPKDAPAHMLRALQDVSDPLEKKLHNAELALFKHGEKLSNAEARAILQRDRDADERHDDKRSRELTANIEDSFGEDYDDSGDSERGEEGIKDSIEEEEEEEEDDDEDEDVKDSATEGEDGDSEDDDMEEEEEDDGGGGGGGGGGGLWHDGKRNNAGGLAIVLEDRDGENVDDEEQPDATQRWKHNIAGRAAERFMKRKNQVNLMELVYGAGADGLVDHRLGGGLLEDEMDGGNLEAENDSDDEELFVVKDRNADKSHAGLDETIGISAEQENAIDRTRPRRRRCLMSIDEAESFGGVSSLHSRAHSFGKNAEERSALPSIWALEDEELQELRDNLKEKFVTGTWAGKNPNNPGGADEEEEEEEVYGDFEDLETGETFDGDDANEDAADSVESEMSEEAVEAMNDDIDAALREEYARRKAKSRKAKDFDGTYDSHKQQTAEEEGEEAAARAAAEAAARKEAARQQRNKQEFGEDGEAQRVVHEGYRQGLYVRVVIHSVPPEFLKRFSALRPVILGGLGVQEGRTGFLKARFKRHRWFPKTLKCQDPLIFSVGWRRFQSLPIFSIEDANSRNRYLKYTPEHMHCSAHFFGALCPPNSGVIAFQKLSNNVTGFRIAGTGVITQLDATVNVVKKLKLSGVPFKVFKNTAFVKDMFSSELEVAKFTGAAVKTVSGIRGTIKKSLSEGTAGSFRATFEDRISMGDIVICRLWVPVEPKRFYNPVTSLLDDDDDEDDSVPQTRRRVVPEDGNAEEVEESNDSSQVKHSNTEGNGWIAARNTSQLRHDHNVPVPTLVDSIYKQPVERVPKAFAPLRIPRKLQAALPYSTKPKMQRSRSEKKGKTYMQARAVVREPEERRRYTLLQSLASIGNEKKEKAKKSNAERLAKKQKDEERAEKKFKAVKDAQKKRKYREMGKEEARKRRKAGLEN